MAPALKRESEDLHHLSAVRPVGNTSRPSRELQPPRAGAIRCLVFSREFSGGNRLCGSV